MHILFHTLSCCAQTPSYILNNVVCVCVCVRARTRISLCVCARVCVSCGYPRIYLLSPLCVRCPLCVSSPPSTRVLSLQHSLWPLSCHPLWRYSWSGHRATHTHTHRHTHTWQRCLLQLSCHPLWRYSWSGHRATHTHTHIHTHTYTVIKASCVFWAGAHISGCVSLCMCVFSLLCVYIVCVCARARVCAYVHVCVMCLPVLRR